VIGSNTKSKVVIQENMKNEHRPTNGPASTMIFFTHNIKIFMFSQRNISHSYKIQVLYGAKITPITNGVKSHTNIPSREAICFFQAKWSVDASFFCRKQNNMQADHRHKFKHKIKSTQFC